MSLPFAPTWLCGDQNARQFLPDLMLGPAGRRAVAEAARTRRLHPGAAEALLDLNSRLPRRPLRDAHAALLAGGQAVAVVTGQQLGLFHGPLFTLHKAISAVAAARQLQAETGIPTVPVFWLQSEDHDAAEIDNAWVPRPPGSPLKLHAPLSGTDRASVGAMRVSEATPAALDELAEALQGLPHAEETLAILRSAWQPGRALTQAVALQMDALLGDAGLVQIDPRHPAMARAAAEIHRQALLRHAELSELLDQRNRDLQGAGFAPQVALRGASPLCFHAPAGDGTARYRLLAEGPTTWRLAGGDSAWTATTAQLLATLEARPETFSTSALLRPLVQDHLLGCAAYIGGPAEIGYLAQIQPLYAALGIAPSRPVLRAGFTWLEPWLRDLLDQWGLALGDLREPHQVLDAMLRSPRLQEVAVEARALRSALLPLDLEAWSAACAPIAAADPGLGKSALHVHQQMQEMVAKLLAKYERALASRRMGEQHKLQRAQVLCWPDGLPQERLYSWPWFGARFGVGRLVDTALAMPDAFAGEHRVEVL